MKKTFIMALMSVMPLMAQAVATRPDAPQAPTTQKAKMTSASAEQKKAMLDTSMSKFDADKDGKLNAQEFAALQRKISQEMKKKKGPKSIKPEILAKYDLNKNGKLDKKERAAMKADAPKKEKKAPLTDDQKAARQAKQLAKYDVNKDGYLDKGELAALVAKKAKNLRKNKANAKKNKPTKERKNKKAKKIKK